MSISGAPRHSAREVLEGGRLKGGMFRSHLSWVREKHPGELDALWDALPPDTSRLLSGVILPSSWYPFAALVKLDAAIARLFSDGKEEETLQELGRYSARINLSTTYKIFDRDTNHGFFENSALVHKQFQDFGDVSYVRAEDGGKMIHRNYPCFSRVFCASAIGYYEATILSHGARRASVRESECQCFGDPSCTFEMRWS